MDLLFIYSLNIQMFLFKIKYLTQIHYNTLMDLLPKMSSENLNQGDF